MSCSQSRMIPGVLALQTPNIYYGSTVQEPSIVLACGVCKRRLRRNPPSTQANLSASHTEANGAKISDSDRMNRSRLTFISSFAELADVVADRNSTAAESEGQRSKFSIPTAPSSLVYFCISSITILPSAFKSVLPGLSDGVTSRQHSWFAARLHQQLLISLAVRQTDFDVSLNIKKNVRAC